MSRRYWEWEPAFPLTCERAALLIIDMQNRFVQPGAPREVPMARDQIPTIAELAGFCRERGIPVVYIVVDKARAWDYPFRVQRLRQQGLPPAATASWQDERGYDIVAELAPHPDDVVIPKRGYDAFMDTDLDRYLRCRGITDVIITGTVVNWCVDSTVRGAFHRGYNVLVVADAVSGYDHAGLTGEQWVQVELDLFAEAFARVATAKEVMEELSAG